MMTCSQESLIAERVRGMAESRFPWPHSVMDDFFPADVFAELVAGIPDYPWSFPGNRTRKTKSLPSSVTDLLHSEIVLDAIRQRHGFQGGSPTVDLVYREAALPAHVDRKDKRWNGQVYVAGDPRGTELYDAAGKLAQVIEWKPNRLSCWTCPPKREKHAAPVSAGRYVLLWWILGSKKNT